VRCLQLIVVDVYLCVSVRSEYFLNSVWDYNIKFNMSYFFSAWRASLMWSRGRWGAQICYI